MPEEQVIEVPADADLVEIVGLIRAAPAAKLLLVLPARPKLFEKFFSLRLIRQNALLVKKEVVLITPDERVGRRASRLGLTVLSERPASAAEEAILARESAEIVGSRPAPKTRPTAKLAEPGRAAERSRHVLRRLAGLAVFLLIFVGLPLAAYYFWPARATITIETDVSFLRFSVEADLSQSLTEADIQRQLLPLEMVNHGLELNQVVIASGDVDGSRASGIVDIYNCSQTNDLVINAETVFVKDGLEFNWVAQEGDERVIPASASENCLDVSALSLRIEAAGAGEEYNLEAGNYQITGLAEDDYDIRGRAMAGGSQADSCYTEEDLEIAQEALSQKRRDGEVLRQMMGRLRTEEDLIPLAETFQVYEGDILVPEACPTVTENQVAQTIIYYLGGVRQEDVDALVRAELGKRHSDLTVLDSGLAAAEYDTRVSPGSPERPEPTVLKADERVQYYVVVEGERAKAGAVLDEEEVLDDVVGIRASQAATRLRRLEGVGTVRVELSPPWRTSLPENRQDILIEIMEGTEEDDSGDGG